MTSTPAELRQLLTTMMSRTADEHGILLFKDARRAGLSERQLRRLVDSGLLVREFRGIYRWAASPTTELQRIKLAVTATGGAVSHQSAARMWGVERWDPGVIHVTLSRGRRSPERSWLVAHTTDRALRGLTVARRGIQATKPLRTLVDVAGGTATEEELAELFAHLVSNRLVSPALVARSVDRTSPGVAGVRRLRALLAEIDAGPAESVAGRDLLRVLAGAGIEKPRTQFPIYREGRFVARADAAWPESLVALEVDGYRYHSDPHSFVADRERGNQIVAAGYRLLRTTPITIRQRPERLCAEVIEALKSGSEAVGRRTSRSA